MMVRTDRQSLALKAAATLIRRGNRGADGGEGHRSQAGATARKKMIQDWVPTLVLMKMMKQRRKARCRRGR